MKPPEKPEIPPKGKVKPKSPEAARAVVKPESKPAPSEDVWKGGVDHFSEGV